MRSSSRSIWAPGSSARRVLGGIARAGPQRGRVPPRTGHETGRYPCAARNGSTLAESVPGKSEASVSAAGGPGGRRARRVGRAAQVSGAGHWRRGHGCRHLLRRRARRHSAPGHGHRRPGRPPTWKGRPAVCSRRRHHRELRAAAPACIPRYPPIPHTRIRPPHCPSPASANHHQPLPSSTRQGQKRPETGRPCQDFYCRLLPDPAGEPRSPGTAAPADCRFPPCCGVVTQRGCPRSRPGGVPPGAGRRGRVGPAVMADGKGGGSKIYTSFTYIWTGRGP